VESDESEINPKDRPNQVRENRDRFRKQLNNQDLSPQALDYMERVIESDESNSPGLE
jgi:hypothetical protein